MVDVRKRYLSSDFDVPSPSGNLIIDQYVQDVKDFSSQYGSDISISYTAYNITGKPSKFPDYGDFPQTFVMRTYGNWWNEAPSKAKTIMPQNYGQIKSQDYIDIMFEHHVMPLRVSIYETYNPGSVVRLWAGDGAGSWALLWQGPPKVMPHYPRIFSPSIDPISFYTNLLRIEFDHSKLEYYTELDAVLLTGLCATPPPDPLEISLWPSNERARSSVSPEEDKSPPGRSLSPLGSSDTSSSTPPTPSSCSTTPPHITQQVLDLELTTWKSDTDISSSLQDLNNLAQHYITLLQDINKGIESTIAPESGFFTLLPDETVLNIFNYLDLISLCRCTRVNKQFNRLASDALLYTELGLRPYWDRVSDVSLSCLSPRCLYLQKLDLSWCGNYGTISNTAFVSFIKECGKLLTHLKLDCCKFVDNPSMIAVAETCLSLKELTLRNCSGVTAEGYSKLSQITSLERLDLYRTYIETDPLVNILKSSPKLKHIVLGSCVKISVMDEVANALGTYNKELISADFWKTYSLTPVGVKALANCSQLEEIDLGWCLGVSIPGDCLSSLAAGCPKLRKLFLAALRGLSDRDMVHFVTHCPRLEQVDLLGVRNVTANMCYRMLRECRELRLLDVSFCDQVPDEAIALWSKKFPQVSIQKSFQGDGGYHRNHHQFIQ